MYRSGVFDQLVAGHSAVKMTRLLYLLLLIPAAFAVPSAIVRPCQLGDYECIGRNLAYNSWCNTRVWGVVPQNYTIPTFTYEAEFFNATYIDTNLTIANHDKCYVSEFFYNLDNDNCVLALRCRGLGFNSTRTLVQHYPEREDVIYSFDYSLYYPEVILTANLRPANAINLCNAQVFSYVSALPNFVVSPNDQATKNFLTNDLSYMNIFERETFAERGNELLRYFTNAKICNFNCDF